MTAQHQQRDKRWSVKLEWVSFVYFMIFVLAVMSPSIVRKSYFGLQQESIEEFLIFAFGIVGLATFIGYNRLMEARLQERNSALLDAERAKTELIDSYRYIGQVNRQIEMLKTLSNQTSMTLLDADAYRQDLLSSILSNAAAVISARHALLRFVDLTRLRTESETYFATDRTQAIKVSNKELRALHEAASHYAIVEGEQGARLLLVGSDRRIATIHAFFAFDITDVKGVDGDVSLLKVFANQAELVFDTLQRRRDQGMTTPMQLIEAVTSAKRGDIS